MPQGVVTPRLLAALHLVIVVEVHIEWHSARLADTPPSTSKGTRPPLLATITNSGRRLP